MNPTAALTERVTDWHADLRVDASSRLVKNVALTGRDSRNGYHYSESALRSAVLLYDHKPVFLDHGADKTKPQERSTRDLVGSIVSPRFEDGRIRGDIRVLDTESGRTFLALAGADTPGVGMSHVVLARRSKDGALVEQIEDVVSVDAVVNPATTLTFRESTQPGDASTSASVHSAGSAAPFGDDVLSSPRGDGRGPDDRPTPSADDLVTLESRVAALTAERDQLLARLQAGESQREQDVRAQRMDALLSEFRLPEYALTARFREDLAAAPSDSARRELLRERLDLIHRAARQPPSSAERSSPPSTLSDAAFLAAIRRR